MTTSRKATAMGQQVDSKEIERLRSIHAELDRLAAAPQSHGLTACAIVVNGKRHEYLGSEVRAWPEMKRKMVAAFYGSVEGVAWIGDAYHRSYNGVFTFSDPQFARGVSDAGDCALDNIARGLCLYRSMLPASPAAKGWVPKVGDRVRFVKNDSHYLVGDIGVVTQVAKPGFQPNTAIIDGRGFPVWFSSLEPAPMPSGSAGKEESFRTGCTTDKFYEGRIESVVINPTRAQRVKAGLEPDPYGAEKVLPDMQRHKVALRNEAARLRNIAALKAELSEPSAQRRARLHPHPGRNFALTKREHE